MEPLQIHTVKCEAVDSATAGTSPSPEVSANMLGECEAVDSAMAGDSPTPEVSANILGECETKDTYIVKYEAENSTIPGTATSPMTSNTSVECDAANSNTACSPLSLGVSASAEVERITRLDVFDALVNRSRQIKKNGRPFDLSVRERNEIVICLLGNKIKPWLQLDTESKTNLRRSITRFLRKCENKYQKSKRYRHIFLKKNQDWLNGSFLNDVPKEARVDFKQHVGFINQPCHTCGEISQGQGRPYTPAEALHLINNAKLNSDSYKHLREDFISRGIYIFPPYNEVMEEKKKLYIDEDSSENDFDTASVKMEFKVEDESFI